MYHIYVTHILYKLQANLHITLPVQLLLAVVFVISVEQLGIRAPIAGVSLMIAVKASVQLVRVLKHSSVDSPPISSSPLLLVHAG